jgi:hypothetical protein
VAGIAVTRYDWASGVAFIYGADSERVALMFQRYDRETDTLRSEGPRFSLVRQLVAGRETMAYVGRDIPAGDYVLKAIGVFRPKSQAYNSLVGLGEQSGAFGLTVPDLPNEGPIKNPQAPRYHFEVGETAYLGDFTLEILRKGEVHIVNFRRNDAGARSSLTANPQVTGSAFAFQGATDHGGQPVMLGGAAPAK